MAKNNDDIATIAYMKGFEDGKDAEAKKAASRIKKLEEERGHIADVIAGLLNVYLRYEDSIDPDHETVEAINRGKAALEALRKDLGTDIPPSSTRAKC